MSIEQQCKTINDILYHLGISPQKWQVFTRHLQKGNHAEEMTLVGSLPAQFESILSIPSVTCPISPAVCRAYWHVSDSKILVRTELHHNTFELPMTATEQGNDWSRFGNISHAFIKQISFVLEQKTASV